MTNTPNHEEETRQKPVREKRTALHDRTQWNERRQLT